MLVSALVLPNVGTAGKLKLQGGWTNVSYETKSEIPYSFVILMCPQGPAGLQYPSSFYSEISALS